MISVDQQAEIWVVYFADKSSGFAYGIEYVALLKIKGFYNDGDVMRLCDGCEHRAEGEKLIVCVGAIEVIRDISCAARTEDYDLDVGFLGALEGYCDIFFKLREVDIWACDFQVAGDEKVENGVGEFGCLDLFKCVFECLLGFSRLE